MDGRNVGGLTNITWVFDNLTSVFLKMATKFGFRLIPTSLVSENALLAHRNNKGIYPDLHEPGGIK